MRRRSARCRETYRGTSLTRNTPPPQGHHMALCIVLLQGPRGGGTCDVERRCTSTGSAPTLVKGLGFGVWSFGCGVEGLGLRVEGLGFGLWAVGCMV